MIVSPACSATAVKKKDNIDIVSLSIHQRQRIGKVVIENRFKTQAPRDNPGRQPVYDVKSSLAVTLFRNIQGKVSLDWHYEKLLGVPKENWTRYTVRFGFSTVFGDDYSIKNTRKRLGGQ